MMAATPGCLKSAWLSWEKLRIKRSMGRARVFLFGAGLAFSMLLLFGMAMRMYSHLSGYLR